MKFEKRSEMSYLPPRGYLRVFIICFYVLLGGACVYIAAKYLLWYILPFAGAWLLSLFLRPAVVFLHKNAHIPRKLSSVLLTVVFVLGVGGVMYFSLSKLYTEAKELLDAFSDSGAELFSGSFWQSMSERFPFVCRLSEDGVIKTVLSLARRAGFDIIKSISTALTERIPGLISSFVSFLPRALFFIVALVLSCVYICSDYELITSAVFSRLPAKSAYYIRNVKDEFLRTTGKFVKAYLLIMLITFCELFGGFLIIGVEFAFFAAVIIAVLDILPVIGAGVVLVPWAVYELFGGDVRTFAGLGIMYVIITVVRQIIEPKILGKTAGLHPLPAVMSMYIGYMAFGVGGLLFFPLVTIIIKNLCQSSVIRIPRRRHGTEP